MIRILSIAAVASIGLSACSTGNPDVDCAAGTIGGAALGGVIGDQFGGGDGNRATTAIGAGAGAVAGSQAACR
ncbi:glycine zipper 2TM domain-containing protein [Amaricoccus tamworthensis]|uniref:glycine zipper 2TM domain-containing protein n=1 Tax=Amaricoccus tamworthensis TaxID=57002 RepID=UPI003C7C9F5E